MHELSITTNIVAIVNERAQGAKVTKVTLKVGQLTAVLPDAIRFCFNLVAQGTGVEGAQLEIIHVPGSGRCRVCGLNMEIQLLAGRCSCGSLDIERLSGEELMITEMVTA
jgi:hydrogenase nickel incorporation protein HypA/HybF